MLQSVDTVGSGISDFRMSSHAPCQRETSLRIPASHRIRLQQTVVSSAPVYHKDANASKIACSTETNLGMYEDFTNGRPLGRIYHLCARHVAPVANRRSREASGRNSTCQIKSDTGRPASSMPAMIIHLPRCRLVT